MEKSCRSQLRDTLVWPCLLLAVFLGIAATGATKAHAVTYNLTGNGLGLPEGNYEPSVTVSPELTVSALTTGNATGYPTGIPGLVFLHLTDGAGVRWGDTGNSSKRISGWGIGSYESLVLDFATGVDAQSITMWFNKIQVYAGGDIVPLDLWITPFSGSAFQISDVLSYLHYTDNDTAYVVFSELPDLAGTGCIERIIVRAAPNYHLYVNQISYQSCSDNDSDGYPADVDCDDYDPDVNPGAVEICNGIDDDCDGDVDEGCMTYYRDADGDGWGDPGDSVAATSPPGGYVATSGDCDDTDAFIYPGASESCNGLDDDCDWEIDEGCTLLYWDGDSDGYGNPAGPTTTVPQSGYVANAGDCDDTDANVNPGETEICNAVDDNCDWTIDEGCVTYYRDADGDTYGNPLNSLTATSPPFGYVTNSGDCNDNNASVNPGATEVCNSVDDNCDGSIDEGCSTYYRDADEDNYGDPAYSVVDTTPPSGYVASSDDCDDTDNTIYPGATELCDGKDNDCDGSTDEGVGCTLHYWDGDSDGYGNPGGPTITFPQAGFVANANDCDDTNAGINPGATEICNGIDDNCDGTVDEGCATYYRDADGDTYGDPGDSVTATNQPAGYVANANDCDDTDANVNPGATEVCNGTDDNCDGNIDEGCVTYYRDADSDTYGDPGNSTTATSQPAGYVANASDCDDTDAGVNPGAIEICNGIDDNCDGTVDEGCATYYRDADGDTYGDPGDSVTATSQPAGYVANANDCDDTDGNVNPGATEICNGIDDNCDGNIDEGCVTYYRDADSDTYGDPGNSTTATSQPAGYVANASDCDDTDAGVNPGAAEICNGVDDNCDGNIDEGCATYYQDSDGDTYGNPAVSQVATSQPAGYVTNASDCDDTDANVNPGATEICNGVDDDCDGNTDEGCATYYQDSDGDTYGNPAVSQVATSRPAGYVTDSSDCDDTDGNVNPGATEICNGIDDNCDGNTDEGCVTYYQDSDGDTYGNPAVSQVATSQPAGYVPTPGDCDDNDNTVYPGASELCDGKDNDCDTQIDEGCTLLYWDGDSDGYGNPAGPTTLVPQSGYVANGGDCDDTDVNVNPGATEICNGIDDNCDGNIDEGCATYYQDSDGDTYGNPAVSQVATSQPAGYVTNSSDCDDTDGNVNPGATEICNGVDDNCDGNTDEGCVTYYQDSDGDTYGNPAVSQVATSQPAGYVTDSSDCDDTDANVNPGATEICNGVDDNCDGNTDEGCVTYYRDADTDTYGDPGNSTTATSQPAGYVTNSSDCDDTDAAIKPGATEICNGVDDNCDGTVDEGCATYYRDADTDTYGDPGNSTTATSQPAGYVANANDCDDTDANVNPGATEICNGIDDNCDGNIDEGCVTYYRDADGDTYGDPGNSTTATSQPAGYVANASDCDDTDAAIKPGATEICNGVDDNCDGTVDEGCATYYRDADTDTYGDPGNSTTATSQPAGYVANASDCDDTDANVNPGATEICNGIDDNCDGNIDEGCVTYYRDADGDTYGDPGNSTTATSQPAGYVANASDCDDTDASINPGATEICNGIDDDCDGQIDDGCSYYYPDNDADGYGDPGGTPEMTPTPGYVANNDDCDDTAFDTHPGATEQCNGVDDDCDGATDEGCVTYYEDADGDGWGNAKSTTTVPTGQRIVHSPAPPPGYVANAGDCDDTNANIHPGATEICDNYIDEDCNGSDASCAFTHGGGPPGGGITVGGVVVPLNKFALVAPWIGFLATIIGVIVWTLMRRQKRGGTGS